MISFFSPLEQFEIVSFIHLFFFSNILGFFDFSVTNQAVVIFLVFLLSSFFYLSLLNPKTHTLYMIPTRFQVFIELLYKIVLAILMSNVGKEGQVYFPLVFTLFFYILSFNLIGLIPYSFTITSHIIVTLSLSLFFFIGINIICINKHGFRFFALFLPSGVSSILGLLLVPIEVISFIVKPFSLAIRLFANMMAGHALLKIIAGFAWSLMNCSSFLFLAYLIPFLVLIPLIGLECIVAIIQAFVFTTLCTIYLKDSLNMH